MRRTATRARCWPVLEPFRALPQCYRIRPVILLVRSGAVAYLVAVYATFDPDDFELRWPPQLFIDEANRLLQERGLTSLGGNQAAGLEDLPEKALEAATPETADRVRHAIALFRSRTAGLEERRSAIIALAGILEERRGLLKAEVLTKDEGALFQIANGFAIRHQRADQRGDYDRAFLDRLFWWYLGTV